MIIETMSGLATPVIVKSVGATVPAASSALAAKAAAITNLLLKYSASSKLLPVIVLPQAAGGAAHGAIFVLPTTVPQAAAGTAQAATAALPAVALHAPTSTSLASLPTTAIQSTGISLTKMTTALNHALQDGSISIQEIGGIVGAAGSSVTTPIQGALGAVQNVLASVQSILLPLAAGVVGGGAAQAGLNRGQQKRTEGKLGELLASVTSLQDEAKWVRDQITTATSWIDQFQAGLEASTEPDPITPETPVEPALLPETPAEPEPTTPTPPARDTLEDIKGIGTVFARRLNEAGIFTFADLAARTPADIKAIVAPGRSNARFDIEDWIAQARQRIEETATDVASDVLPIEDIPGDPPEESSVSQPAAEGEDGSGEPAAEREGISPQSSEDEDDDQQP